MTVSAMATWQQVRLSNGFKQVGAFWPRAGPMMNEDCSIQIQYEF